MIHTTITEAGFSPGNSTTSLVIAGARCWRMAIDSGGPIQPLLHATLSPLGYEQLAPVFDSLMRLCERVIDRRICTGHSGTPTADEQMLCALVTDPSLLIRGAGSPREGGMDNIFDCALRSMRIVLALIEGKGKIAMPVT